MSENLDSANLSRLSEMIVEALDECSDLDLERILQEHGVDFGALATTSREWSHTAIVSHGKARFAHAQQGVTQRALLSRQTVSMDYNAMLALVQAHIANDPHSPLTLAARNQNGALSEEELKSLVEDISSLTS